MPNPEESRAIKTNLKAQLIYAMFIYPVLFLLWKLISKLTLIMSDVPYRAAAAMYFTHMPWMMFVMIDSLLLGFMVSFLLARLSQNSHRGADRFFNKAGIAPVIVGIISLIIVLLFAVILFGLPQQLYTNFQQRINILSPHLTETQEEELLSSWASMRNKADYNDLSQQISSIARKNKIKLPKPF